MLSSLWTRLA